MASFYLGDRVLLLMLLFASTHQQLNSSSATVHHETVIFTSESQCQEPQYKHIKMVPEATYKIVLNLNSSFINCSTYSERQGFFCQSSLVQTDEFALAGSRLCVDIQNISDTMPNTQLLIQISESEGFKESLRIYTTSKFRPLDQPHYKCAPETQNSISVSISVRDSVKMCPDILTSMLGKNISLGTFSLQPSAPVYTLRLDKECFVSIAPSVSTYTLKVIPEGRGSSKCNFTVGVPIFYLHTKACFELLHVSAHYTCNVRVRLFRQQEILFAFDIPRRPVVTTQQHPQCMRYTSSPLTLQIESRNPICKGRFALRATYERDKDREDVDDNSAADNSSMRHLYMAVFISLISVCLLILGLTCVCCLRMRSKRLRRTQRSRSQREPNPNFGYESSPVESSAPPITWSSSNPDQIVGLPTYDEVIGQSQEGGGNPEDLKDEKPPLYEDLYPSTS